MKHVVMGTAGHIDHGKTTLVKRLTGVDTDRLAEEKRRGMTIELGFAPLTLPSGNVVSIIDVPGHERFVKTMVAGATGIDFVLLVIAADEGVMPQTVEHLEILSILGVRAGVVALTKSELVDEEWMAAVLEDIAETLKGTTLEGIETIPVSAVTGAGIEQLVQALEKLTAEAAVRDPEQLFRIPVDRVFTMTGHGTVVTGTVRGGAIRRGDPVEILPQGIQGKVRGIQVHGHNADTAAAGDRCAMNIAGVEKAEIDRGNVIASPGTIRPILLADAELETVRERGGLQHNQRVHFHTGTQEVLARVRVLGQDKIEGGRTGFVQLRFEEPATVIRGDRFIVRAYSPPVTLGGGRILFHDTRGRRRFAPETAEAMRIGGSGTMEERVRHVIDRHGEPMTIESIWMELYEDRSRIRQILEEGAADGTIHRLKETGKYMTAAALRRLTERIDAEFQQLYAKHPFRHQLDREQIKNRIFPGSDIRDFNAFMALAADLGLYRMSGSVVMEASDGAFDRILSDKRVRQVEERIREDGFALRTPAMLAEELRMDVRQLREIERFLALAGRIVDLGGEMMAVTEIFKDAVRHLRRLLDEAGIISTAELRDRLGISRKAAIAILEHLDNAGVTIRSGNDRKPGIHYKDLYI